MCFILIFSSSSMDFFFSVRGTDLNSPRGRKCAILLIDCFSLSVTEPLCNRSVSAPVASAPLPTPVCSWQWTNREKTLTRKGLHKTPEGPREAGTDSQWVKMESEGFGGSLECRQVPCLFLWLWLLLTRLSMLPRRNGSRHGGPVKRRQKKRLKMGGCRCETSLYWTLRRGRGRGSAPPAQMKS